MRRRKERDETEWTSCKWRTVSTFSALTSSKGRDREWKMEKRKKELAKK